MSRVAIALGFLLLSPFLIAQENLNNDSVVKLIKAGLSEDLIITTINYSPGTYDTSVDGLIAMRNAGITNTVIAAIVAKAPAVPVASRTALPVPAQPGKPRVALRSQSHGNGWNASRDQSMEMSKDFQDVCPAVQVSLNQSLFDYIVELNHIEHGFVRDNQMQVANKQGDLVLRIKESGSIKGGVKKACEVIIADWAKR